MAELRPGLVSNSNIHFRRSDSVGPNSLTSSWGFRARHCHTLRPTMAPIGSNPSKSGTGSRVRLTSSPTASGLRMSGRTSLNWYLFRASDHYFPSLCFQWFCHFACSFCPFTNQVIPKVSKCQSALASHQIQSANPTGDQSTLVICIHTIIKSIEPNVSYTLNDSNFAHIL